MTVERFKETLVKIEQIEPGNFGYHPFHFIAEDKNNKMEIHALVGLNSQQCYARFRNAVLHKNKNVIMAVDFPAGQDVPNDFVFLIHYDGKQLSFEMMQYDKKGNIVQNEDREYNLIRAIIQEFKNYMANEY
jgi:hypothetical protein